MARASQLSMFLAAGAVAGSYLGVRSGKAAPLDATLRRLLTDRHTPATDVALGVFTDLGSVYALAGVATSLAVSGRRSLAVEVAGAGATAWVVAQGAKPLLSRPRPYQADGACRTVAVPAGSSWPSGHAALMTAMATTIGTRSGRGTRLLLAAVTAAVGVSRCYVGVHHPSDVVAGIGVGALAARASRAAIGRLRAAAR